MKNVTSKTIVATALTGVLAVGIGAVVNQQSAQAVRVSLSDPSNLASESIGLSR